MGATKKLYMKEQRDRLSLVEAFDMMQYMNRKLIKSKQFSISKSLNNKSNKDGGYSRHDDGRNIG
jgi:hypothetical protein